jgi:DNA-3-methyladenine glycosylase II
MNFENKIELAKNDPILGQIIESSQNPVFNSTKNVFHDLMSCVVEQQIHYRSTKKYFQKHWSVQGWKYLQLKTFINSKKNPYLI